MRERKNQNRKKINIVRRLIAVLISFAMLLASVYVQEMDGVLENLGLVNKAFAANTPTVNYPINSLEDLYDFSNRYVNDAAFANTNQTARLKINFSGTWILEKNHVFGEDTKDFIPIGTTAKPFMGEIEINQTAGSVVAIQTTMPLFNAIGDSVEILNQNGDKQQLSIMRSAATSGNVPLFANTVYHDTSGTSANWRIMASPTTDSDYAYDFSGIIGTVKENAKVNLELDFAACNTTHSADVVTDDNAGLVCGTMESNSEVNVTLVGSDAHDLRTGYNVTTSGASKSAGGLVGDMAAGTTLNVFLQPSDQGVYYDLEAAKTITASGNGSCAGGLVGKNYGGEVIIKQGTKTANDEYTYNSVKKYISSDTVVAKEAAGGIFGHYVATAHTTFNNNYGVDECSVNAKYAGGFAGIFDGADYNISFAGTSASAGDRLTVKTNVAGGNDIESFGGLVGKYLSNDQKKTLLIEHADVTIQKSGNPSALANSDSAFGGLIGFLDGSTKSAVYTKIDDVKVTANSGHSVADYFGGMIGKNGSKGSMIDVGSVTVETTGTYKGGGIVGYLGTGVLRLSGETNLSKAPGNTSTTGSRTKGQIVGKRGASLVYALGTGNDTGATYNSGWKFTRYTNNQYLDDIGTWGEVVRYNTVDKDTGALDTNIEGEDILTFSRTNHTVTVAAPVLNMTSTKDVVKTALNMQLNGGNDVGSLCFNDKTNNSSELLKSTSLTISGEISLSGTGITSLTRDDGSNNAFSGTLSGATGSSSDKILLATGESYGNYTSGKSGTGEIFAHQYNGLFAKIAGGTISDITIGGTMNCSINIDSNGGFIYIGGAAADITNGFTGTNVILNETINYKAVSAGKHYVGGLAGQINENNNSNITISGSTLSPNVLAKGSLGASSKIAGGIAYAASKNSFNISISNSTISFKVNGTSATSTSADLYMAGLIADIVYKGYGANDDTRKVILSGNTFTGCEVKNNASKTTGGLLGYSWWNTDIDFTNNTFDSANVIWTDATAFSALCYKATGYWKLNTKGLKVDSLEIKSKSGSAITSNHVSDFGLIVNTGYYDDSDNLSGIYLEMQTADSYTLASSGVTVPAMTSGVYDEFVAHSGKNILYNDNGVISICLSEAFKMNGTECNSYQNVFNQTLKNENSRYYYNVAANKTSSNDGWKLLIWSLNKYASNNIKRCFTDPFTNNTIAGTFEMDGIPYYPIDLSSDITVTLGSASSTTSFTFYNEQIEKAEGVSATSGNTDGLNRTTIDASQHYLMHTGLFKNVSGTINAVGAVTFTGSVGMNNTYSGVLVNHTLSGSVTTTKNKNITFSNLSLRGTGGNKDDNGYLFIHSMSANSSLTLNSVRLSGYSNDGTTYASSLIGDVSGTDINLRFSDIQIDGRNATGKGNTNLNGLTNVYGTSRSIFKNATLLNKFDVNANSVAIYNYTVDEDWSGNTHNGYVTYGREITDSVEYATLEKKYYAATDTGRKYTNPKDTPTTSEYSAGFSADFLPYVRYFSDSQSLHLLPDDFVIDHTLREIKVNVLSTELTEGCGTYDHPYVISTATQLKDIAIMINGGESLPKICLPKTVSLHSDSSYNHWCINNTGQHTCSANYVLASSTYTATDCDPWTTAQVREYLSGAYYQITDEITLDTFVGLGATTNNTDGKYAFRGVIVGASGAKIINNTTSPLIKVSNGSVVRNLEVEINTINTVVSEAKVTTAYSYSQANLYYGGIIGEIMGGDNIIDNVKVKYDTYLRVNTSTSNPSSNNPNLYNIGGYVGVIVNGGLVFRNMPSNPLNNAAYSDGAFLVGDSTASNSFSRSSDYSHLYINPYVGRVINGYAINETATYSGDSETYTLDNSNKNYRISDVNKNTSNLISFGDFTAEGANDKLCIPDGQSLFMLSLITQSGAGSAPSANGDYAYSVGYDGTVERYDNNSAVLYAATHLADYSYVGNVKNSDNTINSAASTDWTASCRDRVNSTTCVPYIISKYTSGSGESYFARTVTNRTYMIELTTSNGDYKLPECFRGIGSICRFESDDFLPDGKRIKVNNNYTYPAYTQEEMKDEDGKFVMKIYGLKGNNSKIWINLNYKTYYNEKDNYIYTVYKSTEAGNASSGMINTRNHIGFGLFNYVKQIPQSGKDNTTYNTTSGYYIGDFTLTGQVVVKEYSSDGTEQTQTDGYTGNDAYGKNFRRHRHSVGGVIGVLCIDDYVNLVNADMDDITISGPYMVGGYIGRVDITERNMGDGHNMNYIFVNGCDTKKTIVKCGGGHCGGIVAGSHSGYMCVYVNTAPNKNTSDTANRSNDDYYKSSMELSITNHSINGGCGTSAVIGGIRNGYNVNIWINHLSVVGYSKEGECEAKIINDISDQSVTSYKSTTNAVGGYIGYVRKAESIIITNSSVENVSIAGQNAGGLFGYIDNYTTVANFGTSPKIKIYNCDIYADTSGYNITSAKNAGGITGGFITNKTYSDVVTGYDGNSYMYDIDGVNVYNYTISAAESCGGLIGYADNGTRSIVNSSVHDCILRGADNKSLGGIVGTTNVAVSGYNISSYNNIFAGRSQNTTSATKGNLIGITNNKGIKIVAFSRKDNTYNGSGLSVDLGSGSNTNNYIICSDYRGVSEIAASANKAPSNMTDLPIDSTLADVGAGIRGDYFPYANVNPRTNMSATGENQAFLTSDGIALHSITETDAQTNQEVTSIISSAAAIVNDKNAGSGVTLNNKSLYDTAYGNAYSGTDSHTNGYYVKMMLDAADDADIRITTYGNEMGLPGGYNGDDFPVIALGGAAKNYIYTEYIQSYIRLLTNTTGNYNAASGSNYKLKIWSCKINSDGKYYIDKNETDANKSIYINSNAFIMRENKADSLNKNEGQFTLIDVQFLNPMNTKEVAYHLFVPVLTQKMAKFEFHSDMKQGTEYVASDYDEIAQNNVYAGNFDNWTTTYIQFKYSIADINTILNTGRGLNWNSDKIVTFNYTSDKDIADSTQFVLLDVNNNADKEYYANKSDLTTSTSTGSYPKDNVDFSKFKAKNGTTAFDEQTLYNLAGNTIRYTVNNDSGKYYEVDAGTTGIVACAYDSTGGNVKYFKTYESGSEIRYDLSASADITESYYISMYAYSKDNVYNETSKTDNAYSFTVSCPTTLDGLVTSRKKTETVSSVYIGNMFTQDLTFSGQTSNLVVSKDNHELTVTLTSRVQFVESSNKTYFQNALNNAGLKIYQGFLLDINKHNDSGTKIGNSRIVGIEEYQWTMTTSSDAQYSNTVRVTNQTEVPYIYVEPVEISIPSASDNPNWYSTQQAEVTITFTADDDVLAEEFMSKMIEGSLAGNNFHASANLDFSSAGVEYSNIRCSEEDSKSNHRYYMKREEKLDLMLTADDQPLADEYDKNGELSQNFSALGINAKYIDTGKKYSENYGDLEHIEAIANIDVSNLPNTYLDGNHSLMLTLTLKQKQNSGDSGYTYSDVPIDTYLSNFKLISKGNEITGTVKRVEGGDYIYTFPLTEDPSTWLINYDAEQKLFDSRVAFDVITADDFEDITGYLYANYRLEMTAALVDSQTQTNVLSSDDDWIVYTHAKVNPQFVVATPPNNP